MSALMSSIQPASARKCSSRPAITLPNKQLPQIDASSATRVRRVVPARSQSPSLLQGHTLAQIFILHCLALGRALIRPTSKARLLQSGCTLLIGSLGRLKEVISTWPLGGRAFARPACVLVNATASKRIATALRILPPRLIALVPNQLCSPIAPPSISMLDDFPATRRLTTTSRGATSPRGIPSPVTDLRCVGMGSWFKGTRVRLQGCWLAPATAA